MSIFPWGLTWMFMRGRMLFRRYGQRNSRSKKRPWGSVSTKKGLYLSGFETNQREPFWVYRAQEANRIFRYILCPIRSTQLWQSFHRATGVPLFPLFGPPRVAFFLLEPNKLQLLMWGNPATPVSGCWTTPQCAQALP